MTGFRDPRLEKELQLGGLDPLAAPSVFGDLTEYMRQPIETITKEYWRYYDMEGVAAQQQVAQATEEKDVHAYYAATPHFLYQLSYWEASLDKQAWFRVLALACRKYNLSHVLDFGGGIGGLTLSLTARGISSDYLDVAGKTFDYAAWRFRKHNVPAKMFNAAGSLGEQLEGSYDAVITWDVLEHIFDLKGAVAKIANQLRPGGWFLNKSTFAVKGSQHEAIHLAQHAKYSDIHIFNELLVGAGFRFIGQLKPNRISRLLRSGGCRYAVAGVRIAPRLKHGGNFLVHELTK